LDAEVLTERIGAYKCKKVKLPKKDANEVLMDPTLTLVERKQVLRTAIEEAEFIPMEGVKRLDEGVVESLLDKFDNGWLNDVLRTGYKIFDKHFRVNPGDATLFTGIPGDGKSAFMRQWQVLLSHRHGTKWACWAVEETIEDFYDNLITCYVGKSSSQEAGTKRIDRTEYEIAMKWVRDHFFYIDRVFDRADGKYNPPTNDWINERIASLRLQYGVDAYVKDPWNTIYHNYAGQRDDQYLQQEIAKEIGFARQFKAGWYVAHPNNPRKNKDGKFSKVTQFDVNGGAMWNNMMDNILIVSRPSRFNDPKDKGVLIDIRKIRRRKIVGSPAEVMMRFEFWEQRYYEEYGAGWSHPQEKSVVLDYLDVEDDDDSFENVEW